MKVAQSVMTPIERLSADPSDASLDVKALVGRAWRRLRVRDYRFYSTSLMACSMQMLER